MTILEQNVCNAIIAMAKKDEPNYWTRLEHQAAIVAMGGMCSNTSYDETAWVDMAEDAIRAARTLIGKLKEKEERK